MHASSTVIASRSSRLFLNYRSAVSLALCGALGASFLIASGHDLQRCIELLALSITAIFVLIRLARGNVLVEPNAVTHLLLAFLLLGLLSVAFAHSLRHALYEWSLLLLLMMLVFALAAELRHDALRLPAFLQLVGVACGLYSLRVLLMYFAALASGFQLTMHDLAVGFSNARFLNHTQTALLPVIVLLCLQAPRKGAWCKAWFALAAFWWALLFVCEARASVVGLVIACIVALGLRRGHAREFILAMLWSAVAGVILYALLFVFLPVLAGLDPVGSPLNVVARTAADPTSARNLLWKLALQLIAAHPWLGVGPLHFAHEGARLYTGAHPHNWLLQIGAEWGMPALLCLLAAIFLGARALVRSGASIAAADLTNQRMLAMLQVACAAIFVDGLLSGVIVMPQSQLAIALVLGVACAWVSLQKGPMAQTPARPSAATRIGIAVLVVAGAGALAWSLAPDLVRHARGDALTPAERAVNPAAHWSRMWEAGYF